MNTIKTTEGSNFPHPLARAMALLSLFTLKKYFYASFSFSY